MQFSSGDMVLELTIFSCYILTKAHQIGLSIVLEISFPGCCCGLGTRVDYPVYFIRLATSRGAWERSLGTRPSKNRKGGSGISDGVEVYTAPGMQAHFRLAFD